ncbi:MAG TPA: hypothetical protein VN624_18470 [Rhodanobacter sp.]|nr:hypothetical protein [Rhodanobacter sp.]
MAWRRPAWMIVLYTLLWVLLLALLPWWLGLPALLALAAAVALLAHRLAPGHAALIRRALRWGLPGWLFALQHALGGDAFAWGAALLGALAGYTLLAGLEAWLDRDLRRAPVHAEAADWPEIARAPIGPPAEIIELQLPAWQAAHGALADPQGGVVQCDATGCRFSDGEQLDAPSGRDGFAQAGFSPEGRWFAACTAEQRVLLLWDRRRDRRHRLRGWRLCGWYREQPWLSRRDGDMPLALSAVLGSDED